MNLLRAGFVLAAFFLLATPTWPGPVPALPTGPSALLAIDPVPLDEDDPRRRSVGRLEFLAGWQLSSTDLRFGGISAMHVENGEVLAVSDAGTLFRFPVPNGSSATVGFQAIGGGPGTGRDKSDRDAEAMLVHGDQAWIAFEARNQVWRYNRQSWRAEAGTAPAAMRRLPGNSGSEAMARPGDGRFLILSEGPVRDGLSPALLFEGDPALETTPVSEPRYRAPAGYKPTDAALLPDGRILVLHRRFSLFEGISAMLTIVDIGAAGEVIAGEEVAALTSSLNIDNMEALSVTRESGRTIVWIASDDNFSPLQRTLLLKFALRP